MPLAWCPMDHASRATPLLLLTFFAFLAFFGFFAFFATLTLEFCFGQTGEPGIFWNEADECWLPPLSMLGAAKNWSNVLKTPYMKNGNPNFFGIPKNQKAFLIFF